MSSQSPNKRTAEVASFDTDAGRKRQATRRVDQDGVVVNADDRRTPPSDASIQVTQPKPQFTGRAWEPLKAKYEDQFDHPTVHRPLFEPPIFDYDKFEDEFVPHEKKLKKMFIWR